MKAARATLRLAVAFGSFVAGLAVALAIYDLHADVFSGIIAFSLAVVGIGIALSWLIERLA